MTEVDEAHPLGKFPLGSHDSWQFHFYSFDTKRFFSVRLWASTSVHQAWAWTVSANGEEKRVIAHMDNCEYLYPLTTSTVAKQASSEILFSELSHVTHSGVLSVTTSAGEVLKINFTPGSTHFWHVPGQSEGVFHFPNISADITFNGTTSHAVGYCKRYWGDYDGSWGYQFIQGAAVDESKFFWTADATFDFDEYNYFKIYDTVTKTVTCADKLDTWHNNQRAFWRPKSGDQYEVELVECGKMEFMLKSNSQMSKLIERFGTVKLFKNDKVVFSGFGFNEVCYGTVG